MNSENLSWVPIFTVSRSGVPEVTVYGTVYIWAEDRSLYANAGRSLLRMGDTRTPIWSRSLLKPWQLMVILPALKKAYPQLSEKHFALMTASQQSDPDQVAMLKELMQLGGFSEDHLQCPACGASRSSLNNPCAGKHLGYLLYLKARNLPVESYLDPALEPYGLLRDLLGYLLNRDMGIEDGTTDGCGMPNYALSPVETAQLYQALVLPVSPAMLQQCPDHLMDILSQWDMVSHVIRTHPGLVGGRDRLDTELIRGDWALETGLDVIAKEGADGLLCVGIGPNKRFADGLGLYVKLSSGYQPEYLKTIAFEILNQLGLAKPEPEAAENPHLRTDFHFQLADVPAAP